VLLADKIATTIRKYKAILGRMGLLLQIR